MTDDVWRRAEIESPCKKVCVMHPHADLCMGCFRTREEIAKWSRLSPDERREIMAQLDSREKAIPKKRRGGRARRIEI